MPSPYQLPLELRRAEYTYEFARIDQRTMSDTCEQSISNTKASF
jgi:hypothetical protein